MSKNIVVCCDGTWNTKEQRHPTNVSKLHDAIKDQPTEKQTETYLTGVGTKKDSRWDKWIGGFSGDGLEEKIQEAYRFVVQTYEPGDKLFLFGFSRGAYTARSLAGLIRNCGIVKSDDAALLKEAFDLYRGRGDAPNSRKAMGFKEEHSHVTNVHFIGVWDTVGARGVPLRGLRLIFRPRYQFHDVELSSTVAHAYHAMAIDERRFSFKPAIWERSRNADAETLKKQKIEQAWFSGCHTDVGGGQAAAGLSDTAFMWMLKHASDAGLLFDQAYVDKQFNPSATGPIHPSRNGIYKLMWPHVRPITQERAGEVVNDAPVERYAKDDDYRPRNLTRWVLHNPDRLADVASRLASR